MGFNRYNKILRNLINTYRSTTRTALSSVYCNQLSGRSFMSLDDHLKTTSSSKSSSFSTISNSSYHLNGGPSYMRGAVLWEPNKPLTFEYFEMPRTKVNEVLIKTKGQSSFCLLEANAIIPLVKVLHDSDFGACEACLDALLTLINDEELQKGSKVLESGDAIAKMVKLLSSPCLKRSDSISGFRNPYVSP